MSAPVCERPLLGGQPSPPTATDVQRAGVYENGHSLSLVDRERFGYAGISKRWFDTKDGPRPTFVSPEGRTLVAYLPGFTPVDRPWRPGRNANAPALMQGGMMGET